MTDLLTAVRRFADAHADNAGVARTPFPGLFAIRQTAKRDLGKSISRPLACIVVQGAKTVTAGGKTYAFSAGESLLVAADVPTTSKITRASAAAPYYSLVLELDLSVLAELAVEMSAAPDANVTPMRVEPTDTEVADAGLRLLRLLDRPKAAPVLGAQLVREMHYWLLAGKHGAAIRRLGWPDGHAQRVARAVAALREKFTEPVSVEQLAAIAGMSVSSFHQHFRAATSLSPLQFQKQLRLIEARRLMLSDGVSSSSAAFAVGYESVPQFTREYGRMFGLPPAKDRQAARGAVA